MVLFSSCGASTDRIAVEEGIDVLTISHKNTNVYLIDQPDGFVMIDAGYAGSEGVLVSAMQKAGVDPDKIKHLILTHAHSDHVGCAVFFKNKYRVRVIAGAGDQQALEEGKNGKLCPTSSMAKMLNWFVDDYFPAIKADHYIPTGGRLDLTDEISIFSLPGHTPGSLIVKFETSLFVGDLIRGRPLNNDRPNRHYYMCDLDENIRDIEKISQMKGIDTWFPGHFGPLTVTSIKEWLVDQK